MTKWPSYKSCCSGAKMCTIAPGCCRGFGCCAVMSTAVIANKAKRYLPIVISLWPDVVPAQDPRLRPANDSRRPVELPLTTDGRVTNNENTVRKVIALTLALAVQAAALRAPLVHAHPDDHATEHHEAREVHTHWAGHGTSHESSDQPSLGAADHDRAVFLNAFVAVAASSFPAFGVTHTAFELPVPAER